MCTLNCSEVDSTVTLASTNNALPDDGVTAAPKHVGAVLMSILMSIFKMVFNTLRTGDADLRFLTR